MRIIGLVAGHEIHLEIEDVQDKKKTLNKTLKHLIAYNFIVKT